MHSVWNVQLTYINKIITVRVNANSMSMQARHLSLLITDIQSYDELEEGLSSLPNKLIPLLLSRSAGRAAAVLRWSWCRSLLTGSPDPSARPTGCGEWLILDPWECDSLSFFDTLPCCVRISLRSRPPSRSPELRNHILTSFSTADRVVWWISLFRRTASKTWEQCKQICR